MVRQLVVDMTNLNKSKILLASLTKKLELLVQKLLFCHLKKQIVLSMKRKRNHQKIRTRMGLENAITNYLVEFQKTSERHHNKRMELFREYLKYKINSKKE
jgi:hypothetical protein